MSFVSKVVADLKYAVTHPATIQKALVATATAVLANIATFNVILGHVPAEVSAPVGVVSAVATFILTYATPNAAAKAAEAETAVVKIADHTAP
jgi:hypothetical protein